MSFYVTLPSNASLEFYENNTVTNYTTKLKIPLKFNVQYEVAIVEMTYTESWTTTIGYLRFYRDDKPIYNNPIIHVDGTPLRSTLTRIFDFFNLAMRPREPTDVQITIKEDKVTFGCAENEYFQFEGIIKELVNDFHDKVNSVTPAIDLKEYDSNHYQINSLYVYTDIIKYQIVGDTLAPLLRNVQVTNKQNSINTIIYDSPHYNPLNSLYIDTINISIKDDTGEKIHFFNGLKNIVKLHFRPIKYGF